MEVEIGIIQGRRRVFIFIKSESTSGMIGVMMTMSELQLRGELQLYYNKYSSRSQPGSPRISHSLHRHLADPADLNLKRCLLYFDLVDADRNCGGTNVGANQSEPEDW